MKQLKFRTIFVLLFTLLLAAGMVVLLAFYVQNGTYWAAHRPASAISSGTITDRNGVVLYNYTTGTYNEDAAIRTATVHAVGDKTGSIATGAKSALAGKMSSFNLITGVTSRTDQLTLTIDAELNRTAYAALDGRKGTVALYNYKTGDLLCMVSAPAFDPEDADTIAAINNGDSRYEGAYLNRFLSSTYTPGSTFKVVTTAAALETLSDVEDFTYNCTGSLSYGDDSVTCTRAHGTVNLNTALSNSCNCAFATLSNELGSNTLQSYAEKAGLLKSVSVSGLKSAAGSFSTTSSAIDEGWSGVGQYRDLVNPCAELTLMGCIAAGGEAATPRLVADSQKLFGLAQTETSSVGWQSSTCESLQTMMRANVTDHYGQEQFGDLPVCAKSGTAEVGGDAEPHAWFVGFVDSDEYPYAFVVVVENGGFGASAAGSVAATVLNAACR